MRLCNSFHLVLPLLLAAAPLAAQNAPAATAAGERPVVIEGVVPDQATKAKLLNNLRAVYGPSGWSTASRWKPSPPLRTGVTMSPA
jgi:OOP family OmpA-OmpF porin